VGFQSKLQRNDQYHLLLFTKRPLELKIEKYFLACTGKTAGGKSTKEVIKTIRTIGSTFSFAVQNGHQS
jgi:hypothetical protein